VKLGAVIVSGRTAVAFKDPDVPVMVTFAVPPGAVLLAVNVRTLVPLVGLVPQDAVTPVGSPVAASFTTPVNP